MTCWDDPIGGHAPCEREKRERSARSRGDQVCIQVRLGARRKKQTAKAKTVQYLLGVGVSIRVQDYFRRHVTPTLTNFHYRYSYAGNIESNAVK